jgi:hypothetical protein
MKCASSLMFACAAAACLPTVVFSEPVDDAKAAFQGFLDQLNYTWEVSSTRGKPEDANPNGGTEIKGQHEMGGYTKIYFVSGPHILPRGTVSRKPWEGFNDEEGFMSSRWVYDTPDGWKLLSELPNPDIPGAPSRAAAPQHGVTLLTLPILSVRTGFSMQWLGVWRPDQEIAIVIANLASVEEAGPGVYQAELTSAGATKLISPPRMGVASLMVGVRNASATIKFWVRKGLLVRYELSVEGIMSLPIGEHPINYSRTRELSNFGTTIIDVPEEVQHKLGK